MGRLIKYELKKQQTSRNIILALLLVFLLAFAAGIFSDNGNWKFLLGCLSSSIWGLKVF